MIYKIGELCDVYDGPHATPKETESGPVYLGIKAITEQGRIDSSQFKYLSNEDYIKWTKRVTPQSNDIVFSYEATLGRYAIIPDGFHGCLGRRLAIVRVRDNKKLNYKYLYYYFLSPIWKAFISNNTVSGSTVDRISIDEFPNYEIEVPEIKIQNMIVSVLDAVDTKIDINLKTINTLESMAKTLYDYWFVQFDFPDANGHPYKTSGGKMEWNETLSREIPAGWEVGRLADYCSLQRGVTYGKGDSTNIPQDGYEPILRANNIQNHELNFDSLVYLPQKLINEKQYLKNGDILIAMSSGSMEHIGKVARAFYDLNYGFGAFCSKITPLKDTGKQYVYYYVISDEFQLYIHNMCLGTNIRNLTNDHILNSKLCKIPEKILSQFESKMAPIHKKQALLKQENINLSYIRDFLLPMLMNGQVTFRQ